VSLAVVAVLAGGGYPRAVQVSVTGLTAGVAFSVTAATPDGFAWTVRGGNGQPAPGASAVLADISTPLNVAITYTAAQTGWTPVASTPVTVPYTASAVLQSLDGRTAIPFTGLDDGSARTVKTRTVVFDNIPRRTTSVIRWDVSAGESGAFDLLLTRAASDSLRTHLATAGPALVLRTDGTVYDFPASAYLVVTAVSSVVLAQGLTDRIWSFAYTVTGDPEPSVVLAASNWDDFDAAYAALMWAADFDAEWASLTWAQFDSEDWSTH